jgi:hypothetical protein
MARTQLMELGFVSREELDIVKAQLVLLQQEMTQIRNNNIKTDLDQVDRGLDHIPPGFSKDVK